MTKRVLIVDDEPHIRLLLEQSLERLETAGVELHSAGDGRAAIAEATALRPDLVLLDLVLPFQNGFEVCRAIKANPDLAGTVVVILTARGHDVDRATGESVGADGYLTKPFDPDALLQLAARATGVDLG